MKNKFSRYNVLVKREDVNILFNTRTLAMISLEDIEMDMFEKKDYLELSKINKKDSEELENNGFIIPESVSEVDIIKKEYWDNKINSDILHLAIMPTMKCNFKCVYCFEKRSNSELSEDIENNIIKFIEKNINKYKGLHVDWYGGEPLLNIDVIKGMSEKIINICNRNNVIYLGTSTTNGYNLTPKVAEELFKLGIKAVQITIDGPKNIHDNRRILNNGDGTFDKIIENIKYAKKFMKINLRVNVDINTINYVEELLHYLKDNDLLDIDVSIKGVVSADANPCEDTEIPEREFARQVIELYHKSHKLGFKSSVSNMLNSLSRQFCIVDLDSQYIISPKGELFKCGESYEEDDPGRIGLIDEDGESKIDSYKQILWQKDPFDSEECVNCNVLPLCMGGCRMKKLIKKSGWCSPELKHCIGEIISLHYDNIC